MGKINKILLFMISTTLVLLFVNHMIKAEQDENTQNILTEYKPPLIGEGVYLSNRYSLPEDYSENTENNTINENDELITDNDNFELYLDRENVVFKVRDKREVNGKQYVWTSAATNVKNNDAIEQNAEFMLSSFVIEYFNINSNTGEVATNKTKAVLQDAVAGTGYYDHELSKNVSVTYEPITSGIKANLVFTIPYTLNEKAYSSNIEFSAEVTLGDSGLHVNIPNDSIKEDKIKLASIYVMPLLGATHLDDTPGYMFIPDGNGALIRYDKYKDSNQLTFKYYGDNYGASGSVTQEYKTEKPTLSMPIFGAVHGENQNAFLGIIENGDYNAELIVNRSSDFFLMPYKFNWLAPRFIMRDVFNKYQVNQTIEKNISPEDITLDYQFLDNDKANYVGMANSYQQYLVDKGDLVKNNAYHPLRLEVLASDSSKGLLGPKTETFTTAKDISNIVKDLQSNDVNDMLLVLRGWNKGGMSGNSPYPISFERSVGSEREFQDLVKALDKNDIPTYFYNDYTIGYENSSNINARRDIARGLHRSQLTFFSPAEPVYNEYFYLYPESSYQIAKDDIENYKDLLMNNLALDSIGHTLFSYYQDDTEYTRKDAEQYYTKLLSNFDQDFKLSLYKPNAYLWKYTENYFDAPMYSSLHSYYTDSVPFLQVVLKGYINYYAPFSNYFINPQVQTLQMIDYGMYPSFIITEADTYLLKNTNANNFFTTKYNDFRQQIIDEYNLINGQLNSVKDATIISRTTIEPGLVKVEYSNHVAFIINYTTEDKDYEGQTVKATDFIKIGAM